MIKYHILIRKYHQKKEPENKFVDNMRSIITSLSQCIDKVSQIDKKISQADLIKKFHNTYLLCNKDFNKFLFIIKNRCLSIRIHG